MSSQHPDLLNVLPLIRLGMLISVAVIAGLLWYVVGGVEGQFSVDRQVLNLVFLGVFTLVALVVMRVRRQLEADIALYKKCLLVLFAWSAAEGVALLGAVLLLTGDASFFIAGLIVLLMTFGVVSIPTASEQER